MHCLKAFHNRARPPNAGSVITHRCNYMVKHHWDSSLDLWCKLIFFVTFYLRLISFVIFIFHGWRFFFILLTRERMSRVCISVREKTRLCPERHTWTWGDVTLLVLLRRSHTGLPPVLRLWAAAGPLPTAYPSAAVSAALRPGTPGGPTTVDRVARHPPETQHLT